uniref:Kinesin-like protein n=1 Tax=Leptobrachium leishanense TaxID=445787 RepID=A0A8C5R1L9_9ANUR
MRRLDGNFFKLNQLRNTTKVFRISKNSIMFQEDVYESTTKDLIDGVISGYNATVFAYGPTGVGKTYTMLGTDCEPGIYIRTLNDLFKAIEETTDSMDYTVSMSYLEIYNEIVRDLLNPSSRVLELREDSKGAIQITGITECSTSNADEIMELLRKGNKLRTQEPTGANKTSSRSHAVLQVTVRKKTRVNNIHRGTFSGKLFMIDLAGSERASQTQNRGKRMKEGAHINRSLLALGNCITALSERGGNRNHHVNFRDSKLTRLLKDSLGGNSRTVMIAHISPASTSFEESRATLIYACRAKNIKTRVKKNLQNVSYHIAQYTSIISELHEEIERLKEIVRQQEREQKIKIPNILNIQERQQETGSSFWSEEMVNLRDQLVGAFKEQMEMRRSLMQLENTNIELHVDTSRHLITIADWEQDKARQDSKCQHESKSLKLSGEIMMDIGDEESEVDSPEPQEVIVAREELNMLLTEQKKTAILKAELLKRLAETKCKASQLEQLLPRQGSSEDQQEVLKLLCRVHELEVGNTELQAKALCKDNLLCQKDFVILHYQQRRALREQIIQEQRGLIEEYNLHVPSDLEKLYQLYSKDLEERTLNRLQQLHSILPSTITNDSWSDCSGLISERSILHFGMEPHQKPSSNSRTSVSSRARFDLPPIVFESDSDSYSSTSSPASAQSRQNTNLSPTCFHPLKTPRQQNLHYPSPKEAVQNVLSPNSLDSEHRRILSFPQLIKEAEDIVSGTKNISLVAARRRSRVPVPESSLFTANTNGPMLHHMLENMNTKDAPSVSLWLSRMKKATSVERFSPEFRAKADFWMSVQPKSKNQLVDKRALKIKYRDRRSRSYDAIPAEFLKTKAQSVQRPNADSKTHSKATPNNGPSETLMKPRFSHTVSSIITICKATASSETEHQEDTLQIQKVKVTPQITAQWDNTVRNKILLLSKRV